MQGEGVVLKIISPFLRSALYKELSSLYLYPGEDALSDLKSRKDDVAMLFEELTSQISSPIIENVDLLISSINDLSFPDVQVEYVRLFDYRPLSPPYESAYVKMQNPSDTPANMEISIKEFYQRYGLKRSNAFKEPSDHIAVELEFMHFLTFSEGHSSEKSKKDAETYLKAEKEFLENHLLKWVPTFCNTLGEVTKLRFFNLLSSLTKNFISQDAKYVKEVQK